MQLWDDDPQMPWDEPSWSDHEQATQDDAARTAALAEQSLDADSVLRDSTDGSPPVRCFEGIPLSAEDDWRRAEVLVHLRQPSSCQPARKACSQQQAPSDVSWRPSAPFTAAKEFVGSFDGFVYTTKEQGLGYYSDGDGCDGLTPSARQQHIALAQLLPPPAPAAAPTTAPAEAPSSSSRRRRNAQGKRVRGKPRAVRSGALPLPLSADNPWHAVADYSWRAAGLWAIDTANTNVWSTALQYLAVSAADVCLLQEHRLHGEDTLARAASAAKHKGWSCKPNEALRTGTAQCATSSGTAVAASATTRLQTLQSPRDSPPGSAMPGYRLFVEAECTSYPFT